MRIPLSEIREVVRLAREYVDNYESELWPDAEPVEVDDLVAYVRDCINRVERWSEATVQHNIDSALVAEQEECE